MKNYRYLILVTLLVSISTLSVHAKVGRHAKSKGTMGNSYFQVDESESNYSVIRKNGLSGGMSRLPHEGFVPGATMTVVKGGGQIVKRVKRENSHIPIAIFEPLTVNVRDSAGKPLVNARVLFQADRVHNFPDQATQITLSGMALLYVMTDEHGDATLGIMPNGPNRPVAADLNKSVYGYYRDGPFTIIASLGDQKVFFHLVVGEARN